MYCTLNWLLKISSVASYLAHAHRGENLHQWIERVFSGLWAPQNLAVFLLALRQVVRVNMEIYCTKVQRGEFCNVGVDVEDGYAMLDGVNWSQPEASLPYAGAVTVFSPAGNYLLHVTRTWRSDQLPNTFNFYDLRTAQTYIHTTTSHTIPWITRTRSTPSQLATLLFSTSRFLDVVLNEN